jgi:hypothetical protein
VLRKFACTLALCFTVTPSASTGEVLIVSGQLSRQYADHIIKRVEVEKPKQVIFSNCSGGKLEAGSRLARAIRASEIPTVARGAVNSACHLAFMGGIRRTLGSSNVIFGVHAPSDSLGNATSEAHTSFAMSEYRALSSGLFPGSYESDIRKLRGRYSGIAFAAVKGHGKLIQYAARCEKRAVDEIWPTCIKIEDVSLVDIGILTSTD